MLQMNLQNLKRDKTQETGTVIKDSIEFSSTDSTYRFIQVKAFQEKQK